MKCCQGQPPDIPAQLPHAAGASTVASPRARTQGVPLWAAPLARGSHVSAWALRSLRAFSRPASSVLSLAGLLVGIGAAGGERGRKDARKPAGLTPPAAGERPGQRGPRSGGTSQKRSPQASTRTRTTEDWQSAGSAKMSHVTYALGRCRRCWARDHTRQHRQRATIRPLTKLWAVSRVTSKYGMVNGAT